MTVIKYQVKYLNKQSGGCPKGTILRKGYETRDGRKVQARCIKDRGQPGRGPKVLPPLDKKMSLSKFGYKTDKSDKTRQTALTAAVNDYKNRKDLTKRQAALKVLKRVVLIRTYNKSNDKVKKIMTRDVKFLQKKYFKQV